MYVFSQSSANRKNTLCSTRERGELSIHPASPLEKVSQTNGFPDMWTSMCDPLRTCRSNAVVHALGKSDVWLVHGGNHPRRALKTSQSRHVKQEHSKNSPQVEPEPGHWSGETEVNYPLVQLPELVPQESQAVPSLQCTRPPYHGDKKKVSAGTQGPCTWSKDRVAGIPFHKGPKPSVEKTLITDYCRLRRMDDAVL